MNIFIDPEEEVTIDIVIAQTKDKKTIVDVNKEELLKNNENVNIESVEPHQIWFKAPNYAENAMISSSAIKYGSEGLNVDLVMFKLIQFKTLCKKWTFKDKKGAVMEVNEKTINSLNPLVASVISSELEKKLREVGS